MKQKENYYRIKIIIEKNGDEKVTLRKIEQGEERIDSGHYYIRDKDGEAFKFYDKEEAIAWLNQNIKYTFIDPEYRRPSQEKFLTSEGRKATGVNYQNSINAV